ncbi:MAG: phosphatase PAP2 family protein [Planctomycetota bacterium]
MRSLAALLLAALLAGCGTLPNGRAWGEDATLRPGGARIARAAAAAARDPWTWGPLVGAAVFSIDDWDEETSRWARRETPVFGSERDAARASDDLRTWARYAAHLSALATPSGEAPGEWLVNKGQGFLVEAGARSLNGLVTSGLKSAIGRERPNEEDDRSMPSGHASSAGASAALAVRNLEAIPWVPDGARGLLAGTMHGIALATGWARVEAGEHYPTDVLVGAALGNFLARFAHDAFLGLPENLRVETALAPDGETLLLGLTWSR